MLVADADRETHDLTAEVLLRLRLGVALAIEPHQHRDPGHLQQEVTIVAESRTAEELDLSLWPAQNASFVREHLAAWTLPESATSLL